MSDETAELVRALEAERARPDRREPTVEELMQRLIGTLHNLWKTPPDDGVIHSFDRPSSTQSTAC